MYEIEPKQPKNSLRITLVVAGRQPRIDTILLAAIRAQDRNLELKKISRVAFKELFKKKRVQIKGQSAKPSSSINTGTTYVDILGFEDSSASAEEISGN